MSEARLGDLQHAIMTVLWEHGECSAAQVHRALFAERGLAPTTIATMLTKMERKGVVAHRADGRRYIYRPLVTRGEVRRTMLGELTARLFDGSVSGVFAQLLSDRELDPDEAAELRELIDRAERTHRERDRPRRGRDQVIEQVIEPECNLDPEQQ